jgi:hypothetical protein
MDARLSVAGVDPVKGLEDLTAWLRQEPGLRGRVRAVHAVPVDGELGPLADALVVAVSSGGAVSVLAASLRAYLAQPKRSDVRITVDLPGGRRAELDAKRVNDVEGLVRQVLEHTE